MHYGSLFPQGGATTSKQKQVSKTRSLAASDGRDSSSGLNFCSVVNDRRGGVWLTGSAFLLSGLLVSDRNGVVHPVLVSPVKSVCEPLFLTADIGWMLDGFSLHRTTDGGLFWVKETVQGLPVISTVHFLDLQNGWTGGEGGQIFRTLDGGETWKKATALKYEIKKILFVDRLHGWALGYKYVSTEKRMSALLRSSDGGESWQLLSNNDADSKGTVVSFQFVDAKNGWGIEGWQHNIVRTEDGGET